MNEPIVVGFDGSPESGAAADWAAREAVRTGRRLDLVRAWPWPPSHALGREDALRWSRAELARQEAALRAEHEGLTTTSVQVTDDPETALAAVGEGAAMLVLGSRGLGALHGYLVGSVSHGVLARATCPVVLVRPGDPAGGTGPDAAGDAGAGVMLWLDLRHPCDAVVEFAFEAAAGRAVPLMVRHAWDVPGGREYLGFVSAGPMEESVAEDSRQSLDATLRRWRGLYPEVRVDAEAVRGPAAHALVTASASASADLVVLGKHLRRPGPGAHVGPVAHAAVHHVACPVAVVPYL
ncbi:universal stress protein [Kitasatospora sp. NPDC059571]|uniref:universal stress protein n=1 Tax=Kitasatospora sp. NPDC059571 TaxID=3346871 RepID=UPI0036CB8069